MLVGTYPMEETATTCVKRACVGIWIDKPPGPFLLGSFCKIPQTLFFESVAPGVRPLVINLFLFQRALLEGTFVSEFVCVMFYCPLFVTWASHDCSFVGRITSLASLLPPWANNTYGQCTVEKPRVNLPGDRSDWADIQKGVYSFCRQKVLFITYSPLASQANLDCSYPGTVN